jgi:Bacterial PH domain
MALLAEPHAESATSPQMGESIIRDVWPSVAAHTGPAALARTCYRTVFLAPIGWFVLAPLKFKKLLAILPGMSGLAMRYRLTNRRLMVCKGLRPVMVKEVPLDQIKDVKMVTDANSDFFVAATLDVIDANGQTVLSLPGVPEAESVKHAILQAATAWGPVLKNV